jgi:hypothetical protein
MPPLRVTTAMSIGRPRRGRESRGGTRSTIDDTGGTRIRGTRRRGQIRGTTSGRVNNTKGRGRKRAARDDDSTGEQVVEKVVMSQKAPAYHSH